MKTNSFFILLFTVTSIVCFGQNNLGINTSNPLTKVHLDGSNNTTSTANSVTKDDVFITNTGKIGAGVANPITRIDLRNSENTNNIIGIGSTTQSAADVGPGTVRYTPTNGLEYSNGINWITVTSITTPKTIIAATKNTWANNTDNVYCYDGGFNGNQSLIPNRAPCYIRLWTNKYDNLAGGGTFNATTGQFTASRNAIFTATFTFALEPNTIGALSENTNQVEAIWRHVRNNIEINSVKCVNTYSSNSTGNLRLDSSCTANFDMQIGDIIRPELWIDVSTGTGASQPDNSKRRFDISNNGAYNNLTIVEN